MEERGNAAAGADLSLQGVKMFLILHSNQTFFSHFQTAEQSELPPEAL